MKTDSPPETDGPQSRREPAKPSKPEEIYGIECLKEQLDSELCLSPPITEDYDGDSSQAESDDEDGMGWGIKPVSRNIICLRRRPNASKTDNPLSGSTQGPPTPTDTPIHGNPIIGTLIARKKAITELREERDEAVGNNLERRSEQNAKLKWRIEKRKDGTWRVVVQEPCWPENPSAPAPMFLYDNMRDNCRELRVHSFLLRAATCLRRGEVDRADTYVSDALPLATILNYPPLVARCCFWKFLVRHAEGRRELAARALLVAKACVGKYIEGEEVEVYLAEYRDMIRRLRLDFNDEFAKEMREGREKARTLGVSRSSML